MATGLKPLDSFIFCRKNAKIYDLYCGMGQHWDSLQKFTGEGPVA